MKLFKNLLLTLFSVLSLSVFGQITTLISSSTDGGFENGTTFAANGWTAVGTSTRTWRVGNLGGTSAGTRAAYWGTTTAYGGSAASAVGHFYKDVVIPAGAQNVFLNFKLKYPTVDNTYDYVYVFTTTTANTPVNGVIPGAGYTQRFINTATQYTNFTSMAQINLTALAGTTVRLVFTFKSDAASPNSAPAIDEINLQYGIAAVPPSCVTNISPTNGATGVALTSQTLSWNSDATATGYDVYFGTSATPPLVSSNQVGNTYATGALSGSTTYYWRIVPKNGAGSATGCSTWSFTTVSPPPNDLCSGATALPCGTSNLAGTTVNSVSETAPLGYASNFGVWYQFTGNGQSTTITSTTTFDHELDIMTGTSCGSYSIVAAVDGATGTESYTFTTVNGQQYYIYVAHYSPGNTTTGTFTISRTCTVPPTPPVNDLCSSPTSLPCGTTNLAGTTVNASLKTAPGGGGLASNYGVWYTFTGDGGQTTVSATGTGGFDIEMTIVQGTCASNTLISSQDGVGSGTAETFTFTTVNGATYYVYIAYWSSSGTSTQTGTFTISRSCVPPCTTPTTAGTLSVSPSNTGTVNDGFTFTTTGNAGTVTNIEWSFNNFSSVAGSLSNPGNPSSLVMNVYQQQVWVRTTSVNGSCPAGTTAPVLITLQLAPPFTYGTSDGDYISNVTLNTINNNSTYDLPLGDSYQNFTNIFTGLDLGGTYTISVSSPASFASTASGYAAWIDFNNNGIFEVSENIMQRPPATTQSQTFSVPTNATLGSLKMRVVSVWNATPSTESFLST